ncbi:MAG TPA: GNAT family N-acetyltransferase [Halanaerobiales bacterium]|nr:GNAT family N-acetyltransferase [Halanaerobiales bacterium]
MLFRKPKKSDISYLIKLSKKFKQEYDWTDVVPIANIDSKEKAKKRLFADNIKHIVIAEENDKMVGYLAVKRYEVDGELGHEASIIIHTDYRNQGLAKKMTEKLFQEIPPDIEVEAWVLKDNIPSIKTVKSLGFEFDRNFAGDKRVQIYTKGGEK